MDHRSARRGGASREAKRGHTSSLREQDRYAHLLRIWRPGRVLHRTASGLLSPHACRGVTCWSRRRRRRRGRKTARHAARSRITLVDRARETARGEAKIGPTGRGSAAYEDKVPARIRLRTCFTRAFRCEAGRSAGFHNSLLRHNYKAPVVDFHDAWTMRSRSPIA